MNIVHPPDPPHPEPEFKPTRRLLSKTTPSNAVGNFVVHDTNHSPASALPSSSSDRVDPSVRWRQGVGIPPWSSYLLGSCSSKATTFSTHRNSRPLSSDASDGPTASDASAESLCCASRTTRTKRESWEAPDWTYRSDGYELRCSAFNVQDASAQNINKKKHGKTGPLVPLFQDQNHCSRWIYIYIYLKR